MTHGGDGKARVALHAPPARGSLARYLDLTVVRGARRPDASGACAGFVADGRDYGLTRPGAIFHGRLSDFPAGGDQRVVDPAVWSPGDAVGYRFELRLADDPDAEGLTTAWDWRLAVEPLPGEATPAAPPTPEPRPAEPPAACRTLVSRDGHRLVRRFAYPGRRRLQVDVKVSATGARLSARLLGRRGQILRDPRWRRVSWTVNDRTSVKQYRRPFTIVVPPRLLHDGANVVVFAARLRDGRLRRVHVALGATSAGGSCSLR